MGDGSLQSSFRAWAAHPFSSTGSALNWTLFVGLIVIAAFLWQLVLLEIAKGIGE